LTLCHPLDYLYWLFGRVAEVTSFSGRLSDLDIQVEDTAEIILRHTNGNLASLHLDYYQRPTNHRIEIAGTQGMLIWDNSNGSVSVYKASPDRVENDYDSNWKSYPAPNGFSRNEMFLAEMHHFLAVVRGEANPICSLDDGICVLKIALAAYTSQARGQKVCLDV
jgi:predicted dehydrogenase